MLSARDPGFGLVTTAGRATADAIEIVAYDPAWPAGSRAGVAASAGPSGATALRIEHIGSTAVPGLPAKRVIDVQVSVDNVEAEAAYVPAVEALGVALRARDSGHCYFRPAGTAPRAVQIHVCVKGSAWERVHLLFRDYLRANREAAEAYSAEKRVAARMFRDDRIAYNEAKAGFILDALGDAEVWVVATGWRT